MYKMLFIFLFCSFACHKDTIVVPPVVNPPINSKLNIVWQVPILSDTSENSTVVFGPVLGNPVYCLNYYEPSGAFIQVRDGLTGALKWKYDQWIQPLDGLLANEMAIIKNKVIVNDWHRTYCLDGQSGALNWAIDVTQQNGNGEPHFSIFGDCIYKNNFEESPPITIHASIVRSNYLNGHWDTLVNYQARDSFVLGFTPPSIWVNPQGDTVLIIRDNGARNYIYEPYKGARNWSNIYAYNLHTKRYDWKLEDFQNNTIMYNPPIISNDRYYVATLLKVHCIDLKTGQTVWSKALSNSNLYSGFVQHKNWLIAQGTDHGIWALDMDNGKIIWYNPQPLGLIDKLFYYDGVVYFTSSGDGRLYAINAEDGSTIWAERSPNRLKKRTPNATFGQSYVAIDPDKKVIYVSDNYYAMCIKMPEH
ncbi:MAG: PQQ-binding-like beta-propeller repeat protein [Bacteroidota bacterium]